MDDGGRVVVKSNEIVFSSIGGRPFSAPLKPFPNLSSKCPKALIVSCREPSKLLKLDNQLYSR